ncbi:MAG: hypothetical protein IKG47_03745 [Oscillospiraceae bacterium]|nr:hypothetical protein [Oscillospiraceae bacterium]
MFREYAVGAKKDDNHLFQKNGFPDTDWQAKLILILEFGIVECETKTSIENQLVKDIEEQYYCFGTGLQFTPFVLKPLRDSRKQKD